MTTTTKGLGVMVIGKNNTVLALSGAIPFALSVIFAMYMSGFNWKWLISLVIACAIIATWSFYIIHERKKKGERIKLEVSSVSQVTGEIFGSFLAYVLPLVFSGMSDKTVLTITFACSIYLILLIISNIVYPSWIFSLAGYRLYKIVLQNNIEVLLLSKQNVFNIAYQTINTVEIDNCCFMDVGK